MPLVVGVRRDGWQTVLKRKFRPPALTPLTPAEVHGTNFWASYTTPVDPPLYFYSSVVGGLHPPSVRLRADAEPADQLPVDVADGAVLLVEGGVLVVALVSPPLSDGSVSAAAPASLKPGLTPSFPSAKLPVSFPPESAGQPLQNSSPSNNAWFLVCGRRPVSAAIASVPHGKRETAPRGSSGVTSKPSFSSPKPLDWWDDLTRFR